jgi:hypothetical protein
VSNFNPEKYKVILNENKRIKNELMILKNNSNPVMVSQLHSPSQIEHSNKNIENSSLNLSEIEEHEQRDLKQILGSSDFEEEENNDIFYPSREE